MSTSRKDYEAVARVIRAVRDMYPDDLLAGFVDYPNSGQILDDVTFGLAEHFAESNPNFRREQFYAAAGSKS